MKPFGRKAMIALFLPAAVLAAGYLNAWAMAGACADEAYREGRGRAGYDMKRRPLPLRREHVSARIVAPFVVEASYLLPADLHGVVYTRTYLVFGDRLRLLDSDAIPLVDARSPHDANERIGADARARVYAVAQA
ncbi:hypothetical protein [Lysobacter enzymogenes]|uniref:hypothetical protein n=1 Tax=Lysobacter enzymogenes TaxID=69 RepID=UPI00099D7CBD|nr:hypothetical protein [Lysobacter enzymogenes]UZW59619.1 hypothetical protein BV903_020350 [Lysobacter enzymogenes]